MASSESENEKKSLLIDEFSSQILGKIFYFLEATDLRNCRLVNKSFYNVIGNFNQNQLGLVELNRDWRISSFLTSIISDENSSYFTNFSLAVKYLSREKIENFLNSQGNYLKNLKICLHATQNPQEIVEKLDAILNRAPHLRTLVLYYAKKVLRYQYGNEDTEYLPQNLNLNPILQFNSLKKLSFKGLTLDTKDLQGVEILLSKSPNLENFEIVIENRVIPNNEFKSLVKYLKKPLLSLTILLVDEKDDSFFGTLLEYELKFEEFGITTDWLREGGDFKKIEEAFTARLMHFLHANSGTLKSLKLARDFMSTLNFSQLPTLTSLTLDIDYGFDFKYNDIKEVRFPQNLLKINISSKTLLIFKNRDIKLPSVRELITDSIYTYGIEIIEEGQENPVIIYVNWAQIFPNVQIIRISDSTPRVEKYIVEHMSTNLKELELWNSYSYKSSLWNTLVGKGMKKMSEEDLYNILEKKNSGEEISFENIVPENFVPKASNLKKLQKLRLFSDGGIVVAEDYVETLVFLSITKWLQPLDLLYINLPPTYKHVEIHPSSFIQFLQKYHKKVQISYETLKNRKWPFDHYAQRENQNYEDDIHIYFM